MKKLRKVVMDCINEQRTQDVVRVSTVLAAIIDAGIYIYSAAGKWEKILKEEGYLPMKDSETGEDAVWAYGESKKSRIYFREGIGTEEAKKAWELLG